MTSISLHGNHIRCINLKIVEIDFLRVNTIQDHN